MDQPNDDAGATVSPGSTAERRRAGMPPIGIWTGRLEKVPMAQAREAAAELEDLGYGAIWLPEVAGRDVFVHLALLLASTSRLVGATGIANIWARDPLTMAGAAKALTEAFPERVILGLGVSHRNLVETLRGHDYERPLARMRAYLEAMDQSSYSGFRPTTPVRRVLGALGPKMLELARDDADGAHPYFVTPEHTASARLVLGAGPLLCPEQAVHLETDPQRARDVARQHVAVYLGQENYVHSLRRQGFAETDLTDGGSDRLVDAIVAWGSEDAVLSRVRAHFDAGADHVCLQMLGAGPRELPLHEWRTLAGPLRELTSA